MISAKVVNIMLTKSDFFGYDLYTVKNGDMEVSFCSLGGIVTEIKFKGKTVSLGYADAQGYMDSDEYMGAIVGRCANRTSGAKVTVNRVEYKLAANVGENMLHGGVENLPYCKRLWACEVLSENSLRFSMRSPHLDNGFAEILIFSQHTPSQKMPCALTLKLRPIWTLILLLLSTATLTLTALKRYLTMSYR